MNPLNRKSGLRFPATVGLLALVACLSILFPLLSLVRGTQWASLPALASAPENVTAALLSVMTASLACAISTTLGFALALVLARARGILSSVLRAFVLVPLVLPPVVSGIALVLAYGRNSLLAPLMEAVGVRIVFSTSAVVLAQVFVSLPFVVLTLESAFRARGFAEERAAASLGARPRRVLTTVTLPRFAPSILLAATLAFARSLGEFGATLTFAGSLAGTTRTLPLQIYLARESDLAHAVGLSVLLAAFSLLTVSLVYARGPLTTEGGQQ